MNCLKERTRSRCALAVVAGMFFAGCVSVAKSAHAPQQNLRPAVQEEKIIVNEPVKKEPTFEEAMAELARIGKRIRYLDEKHNIVPKEKAYYILITEYDKEGFVKKEMWLRSIKK